MVGKEERLKTELVKPTVIASTYLQQNFGEIMRRAHNGRESFIVQRAGLSVFVILPMAEYETLTKK